MPNSDTPEGSPTPDKKQRREYLKSGGVLQGYAPEVILKIATFSGGGALLCLLIATAILLFLPYGWGVRGVAAAVWLLPIIFATSLVLPAFRLALKDRREEPRVVRGQLLGASPMSTSFGMGMLMLQTRGGNEQYLVEVEKLARIPGNQVSVILTLTPRLRHVRSVGVMGQRMVPLPQQEVPAVLKRLRLLPLATPAALSLGAIVGGDAVGFSPIPGTLLHALLAAVVAILLAAVIYALSFFLQRRLYGEVQALMPGAN
ncbi:MAG: hypothetical protein ACREP9_04290 [Candidatus Dormibacteraceae bacterium]